MPYLEYRQVLESGFVMPEERSIGFYLRPLGKHTLLIGLLVLLAAIGSLAVWTVSASHLPFEAETLLLFKTYNSGRVDLSQPTNPQFRDTTIDITRQQKNVVLLADSMEIANKVAQQAAASSDPDVKTLTTRGPLGLRDEVSVQPKGDFVSIKATGPTAAAATWLANAWANQAVLKVNEVYSEPSPNVNQAVDDMKTQLASDQKALQDFMANNPINSLTQELSQTIRFIDAATRSGASTDFTLYDAERQSIRDQITSNYTATNTLDDQINELQALRTRIDQSPDNPGALSSNQLALVLLLNNVLAGNASSQVQLQLNMADLSKNPLTKSAQLAEVDSTTSAVRKLQSDIRSQTAQLEARLSTPVPAANSAPTDPATSAVQAYVLRRNQLESELERMTFQLDQLQKTRDLHQTTYDLLRSRAAEQQVNGMVSGIVDIGSPADESQTAQAHSTLKALALSLLEWVLVAFLLGVGIAYLAALLRPNFNSNDALRKAFRRSGRPRRGEAEQAAGVGSGG